MLALSVQLSVCLSLSPLSHPCLQPRQFASVSNWYFKAFLVPDTVVIYGGFDSEDSMLLDDTWLYFPTINIFVFTPDLLSGIHSPPARFGGSLTFVESGPGLGIFLFGGYGGSTTANFQLSYNDVWFLDVVSEDAVGWKQMNVQGTAQPKARSMHSAAAVGDAIYIFGALLRHADRPVVAHHRRRLVAQAA